MTPAVAEFPKPMPRLPFRETVEEFVSEMVGDGAITPGIPNPAVD
jgi:hypothetical protein